MSDTNAELPEPLPSSTQTTDELPPLLEDGSFWGMGITQFLGAFNDNLFRQLILLLATPTAIEVAQGGQEDRQSEAQIVFAFAFLIFSGFAGWLADKISKRTLIISAKMAEIVVMIVGLVGFYYYESIGLKGMLCILFFMGLQSAFFGPPKYGILPETIRDRDLPQANGIFLMFTFMAIIFGTVLAGALGADKDTVWQGASACVLIAVIGTATAFLIRPVKAANPDMKLSWSDILVPPDLLRIVYRDKQLMLALIVTSMFWMLGGIVQQSVNALGKTQLGLSDGKTSLLAAMLGIGIPIGCLIGGKLSAGRINPRVVLLGAIGIVICLSLLALRAGDKQHLLGEYGSYPVLILAGISTGIFIVPIQVSIQALPPPDEKGRMIALMNQCNWIGIIAGALLVELSLSVMEHFDQPRNTTFAIAALVMLPVALFYRPEERSLAD